MPSCVQARLFEVYDRAHFPTVDIGSGLAGQDSVPLPFYKGRPIQAESPFRIVDATGN